MISKKGMYVTLISTLFLLGLLSLTFVYRDVWSSYNSEQTLVQEGLQSAFFTRDVALEIYSLVGGQSMYLRNISNQAVYVLNGSFEFSTSTLNSYLTSLSSEVNANRSFTVTAGSFSDGAQLLISNRTDSSTLLHGNRTIVRFENGDMRALEINVTTTEPTMTLTNPWEFLIFARPRILLTVNVRDSSGGLTSLTKQVTYSTTPLSDPYFSNNGTTIFLNWTSAGASGHRELQVEGPDAAFTLTSIEATYNTTFTPSWYWNVSFPVVSDRVLTSRLSLIR